LPRGPDSIEWRRDADRQRVAERQPVVAFGQRIVKRGPLRAIAAYEAVKGITAIAAGVGLLGLLQHGLRQVATALIGHIGLDPGAHYPSVVLHAVDALRDANLRSLALAAFAYALVRLLEAYGLWHDRVWGEWLAVLSGALYVPFEVRHLIHRPTAAAAVVIAANLAIVAFLAWQLSRRRRHSFA
jgi:uncharacterized membrane protein (DUF2068 family)